MGEVLTSDLLYGGNLSASPPEQPKLVQRGEALPSDYEGPPSEDELRELGVLQEDRVGLFEPQGGVKLPGDLGMSISALSRRQAELRARAIEDDPNQEELHRLSLAGEELNLGEAKADKKAAEASKKQQIRPEAKESTDASSES